VDREDATFILRPALNGNADAVSFESVNYPGLFLRHQDFRLKLTKNDASPLFKDDASFFKRAALAGGAATASFEASKYPGFYIRHRDFHLWLEKNDPPSDIFKKDATFIIEPGLVAATSAPERTRQPEGAGPATAPPIAEPEQAPELEETEPANAAPNAAPEQAAEPRATNKSDVGRPPPGGRVAKVIADVPVYAAPGGKGEPVGMLRAGTTVSVLGACPQSWCNVRGDDVPGRQGWVYDGANYNSLQY
jgi:hypothetical protein